MNDKNLLLFSLLLLVFLFAMAILTVFNLVITTATGNVFTTGSQYCINKYGKDFYLVAFIGDESKKSYCTNETEFKELTTDEEQFIIKSSN